MKVVMFVEVPGRLKSKGSGAAEVELLLAGSMEEIRRGYGCLCIWCC